MRPVRLIALVSVLLALLYAGELLFAYETIPQGNTAQRHFDVLVILGNPVEYDGTPSPEQRERVLEGVREFKAGIASHIIMTGGAVLNQFQEAHSMARIAIEQGVPPEAVTEEVQARNTVQNIFYSERIMRAHGWHSVEVISSPSHLPRTALILAHYSGSLDPRWHTHPAHWPPRYLHHEIVQYFLEANACLLFRALGFHPSPYLPGGR